MIKSGRLICTVLAAALSGAGLFAADSNAIAFEYVPGENARYWQAHNPQDGKVHWDWGDATAASLTVTDVGSNSATQYNFTKGTDAPEWTIPVAEEKVYDLRLSLTGGAENEIRTARVAKLAAAPTILVPESRDWGRVRANSQYVIPIDSAWYGKPSASASAVQLFTTDTTPQTKVAHLTSEGAAYYTVLSTRGLGRYAKFDADLSFDAVHADLVHLAQSLGLVLLFK